MIKRIMLKEVNDIKVSVIKFKDYEILGEAPYEVAIIDADDVQDIGRYYTEAEAVAKAEEIIAQASIETVEATIVAPVIKAEEIMDLFNAMSVSVGDTVENIEKYLYRHQRLLAESVSGYMADTVTKFMINYFGHFYDENIIYNYIEIFLNKTMYKQNVYNKEFNKFFSYWVPKAII